MKRQYKKPGQATDKSIRKSKGNILFKESHKSHSPERIADINKIMQENMPPQVKMKATSPNLAIKKDYYLSKVASEHSKLVTAETFGDIMAISGAFIDANHMKRLKVNLNKPISQIDKQTKALIMEEMLPKMKTDKKKVALAMALGVIPNKLKYLPRK